MSVFDDLKDQWSQAGQTPPVLPNYDQSALESIRRTRARKQVNRAMQYFWGAFVLQIIVYALLSHVFIRFWGEPQYQWLCVAGILVYIPFTVMLLRKFKQIAVASPKTTESGRSVQERILHQYLTLVSFYRFKKVYEYALIPVSTALGVFLLFQLYVPGGVGQHLAGAVLTYVLSLLSCVWAIRRENRNQFDKPIDDLRQLLSEFEQY